MRRNVRIGNNVCIARECQLWTHGYFGQEVDGYPVNFGEILIEDDVWISPRTIILPGVTIGSRTVIGTGTIITKDILTGGFFAGVPAKQIKTDGQFRKEISQKDKLQIVHNFLQYNLSNLGYCVVSRADRVLEVKSRSKEFKIFFIQDTGDIDLNPGLGSGETIYFLFSKVEDHVIKAIAQRPNATYFDVISKKYLKKNLECEVLLKSILNERMIRFTRVGP